MLLRRELSPDGEGRAFVEDEPASVRTLARIGERLVAIHGQSSEQELVDAGAALELLDAFAKSRGRARRDRRGGRGVEARRARSSRRSRPRGATGGRGSRCSSSRFARSSRSRPLEREDAELPAERERLLHADRIRRAGETALWRRCPRTRARRRTGSARRPGPSRSSPRSIRARRAHRDEAEDLKRRDRGPRAARRATPPSAIEADPDRLTALETRLEQIARLKRKYGGSRRRDPREARGAEGGAAASSRTSRTRSIGAGRTRPRRAGRTGRRPRPSRPGAGAAAPRSRSAVEKELQGLAMEKARLRVALEPLRTRSPRAVGRGDGVVPLRAQPGRAGEAAREDRLGRRALAAAARDPVGRGGPQGAAGARSSSTRWTPASAGAWPRSSARSCGTSPRATRSSA